MNQIYLTTALALCLSACATVEQPASRPASEPAASAPNAAGAATESPAPTETAGEGIIVVDTPDVPNAAVTEEEYDIPNGDERVCRRERRTGTHRAQRVCYTRAEIERMAEKSRDILDDINRSSRAPIEQ